MAEFLPSSSIDDARYCIEQARIMLESARSRWFKAYVEEMKRMRASLHAQIKELAKNSPFRRQFKTTLLSGILDTAIESTGADMSNIQLFDPKAGQLVIYVHRGFHEPFLEFFNSVHSGQAACGTAFEIQSACHRSRCRQQPHFSQS